MGDTVGTVDLRRKIPSVDDVLRDPEVAALEGRFGRDRLLATVREVLAEARERAADQDSAGLEASLGSLGSRVESRLAAGARPSLISVINATGVVIHTNLGRAPLPKAAAARVAQIASSYSNLEYDLDRGTRGRREVHVEGRLTRLVGSEGALVVNNNAAAVFLVVNALAEGREVIVSRGELVEIGGAFRIPDVLRKGGARLVEVGTTNRTRIADYRAALGPQTALILKVHPSNFRIVGFTEAPSLGELVSLGREARIPVVEDQGSGFFGDGPAALGGEPSVGASVTEGVDLVTMSGDKLLGGPQAGLIVGRRELLETLRSDPLYRALRVDKMTLAALDAVLAEHEAGRARGTLPVAAMLWASAEDVRQRADALAIHLRATCPRASLEVRPGSSAVGGGAAPTAEIPTALLALTHAARSADDLAAALRSSEPPIIARVVEDRLIIDLRTVLPDEEPTLRDVLARVLQES